jgi:hypothetical protein
LRASLLQRKASVVSPIAALRSISPARFRMGYMARSRPVLLQGAVAHWPALARWTPEELRRRLGDRAIQTFRSQDGHATFDARRGLVLERLPLAAFIDQIEGKRPLQNRVRCPLDDELPALLADIDTPPYCKNGLPIRKILWWSGPSTVTRLHFDQPHNLLTQVAGEKRFTLFPPSDRRLLYPNPLRSSAPQFSQVDLRSPDLSRFPRLSRARPLSGTLRPGDALFIPGGHWHYLEADDATISVGFTWGPWTRLPLVLLGDLYKRLRGLTR